MSAMTAVLALGLLVMTVVALVGRRRTRFHDRTEEILDNLAFTVAVLEADGDSTGLVRGLLTAAANDAYVGQLDHLSTDLAVAWIRNRVEEKLSAARFAVDTLRVGERTDR